MEFLGQLAIIAVSVIFVNNYVFAKYLGLCPFIGVSKSTDSAFGMGMACCFVMTLASIISWTIQAFFLAPTEYNLFYRVASALGGDVVPTNFDLTLGLQTITFILSIASLVQIVEVALKKLSPTLYESLGVYLPLITTNCAILGVAILNVQEDLSMEVMASADFSLLSSFLSSAFRGLMAGVGFTMALLLMSGIRERLEFLNLPPSIAGAPMAFVCTGFMSLAFMGFAGVV